MDDSETVEDIIAKKVWESSVDVANIFSMDIVLPLLAAKEKQMINDFETQRIHDPFISSLITLFAINQMKGWDKDDLLKILLDVNIPEEWEEEDEE